jgi:hypothetical protein
VLPVKHNEGVKLSNGVLIADDGMNNGPQPAQDRRVVMEASGHGCRNHLSMPVATAYGGRVPTSRDLMLTDLHRQITWFRAAPRTPGSPVHPHGRRAPHRLRPPTRHPLSVLTLCNRDHEAVVLRPLMWVLFDV